MKRRILFGMILMLGGLSLHAENRASADSLIIQGKTVIQEAVDAWQMPRLLNARGYFERLQNASVNACLVHYYLGYIDWRITALLFSQDKMKGALPYIEDGIQHLEKAVEMQADFAEAQALLSSLLGNKIAVKPILGMTLGMKSGALMGKAESLSPDNPRILLLSGQSDFYTPKMFGGSKTRAMEKFQKAVALFKTFQPENLATPVWGEEDANLYLGLAYMESGNLDEAENQFKKVLEIKPGNGWVLYGLLPEIKKRRSGK